MRFYAPGPITLLDSIFKIPAIGDVLHCHQFQQSRYGFCAGVYIQFEVYAVDMLFDGVDRNGDLFGNLLIGPAFIY